MTEARYTDGMRVMLPLMPAIIAFGASFGVLARAAGVDSLAALVMSATTFAGSAQFAVVSVLGAGGTAAAAIGAAVLLNARYAPMALAASGAFRGGPLRRLLEAQLLVDESWALSSREGGFDRKLLLGAGAILYVGWNTGTAVGVLAGDSLTDPATLGLDAAFPALFLALLAPLLRTGGPRSAASAPRSARGRRHGRGHRACAHSHHPRWRAGDRRHCRLPGRPHAPAAGRGAPPPGAGGVVVSAVWLCVTVVGLATIAVKAGGPVLAAGRDLPQGVGRVVDLLAPALLAALVATQAFTSDEALVLDERAAGLLAGGAAILLRAPLLVVVLVAAATAGGLRAIS
jgi:predicted branched-subunit amino acid permease/branched-subunit amino acid transport protein